MKRYSVWIFTIPWKTTSASNGAFIFEGSKRRPSTIEAVLIALHSLATMHCNLMTDIRIAKETEYQGIEINGSKLRRYLAQGYPIETVKKALDGLALVGLIYVQ